MASEPHGHCRRGRGGTPPLHNSMALSCLLRDHHPLLAAFQALGRQPPFSPLDREESSSFRSSFVIGVLLAAAFSHSQWQPFGGVVAGAHRVWHCRIIAALETAQGIREALVASWWHARPCLVGGASASRGWRWFLTRCHGFRGHLPLPLHQSHWSPFWTPHLSHYHRVLPTGSTGCTLVRCRWRWHHFQCR